MDFGKVLTRSWEIIWKNKGLWIFGILASCSGGGANFGSGFNYSFGSKDVGNLPDPERMTREFERFLNQGGIGIILAIVCVVIILGLLLWIIGIFGKVSLISGVLAADAGGRITFRSVAALGWKMLGSALGLNLVFALLSLAALIIGILIFIPIGLVTLGFGFICLACLLVPLAIAFTLYMEIATIALVREQQGIGAALSRAWELLRTQTLHLVAMGVVLFVGGLIVGLILAVPLALVALPAILSFMNGDAEAINRGLLTSGVLIVIALPIYLVLRGIMQSYVQSAWTLTYLQLAPAAPTRARAKRKAKS